MTDGGLTAVLVGALSVNAQGNADSMESSGVPDAMIDVWTRPVAR
jgi:hypothetical protein